MNLNSEVRQTQSADILKVNDSNLVNKKIITKEMSEIGEHLNKQSDADGED